MKGIRKLFLGLVFLTLFGVGFKVETNAATKTAPKLSFEVLDWSASDPIIKLKMEVYKNAEKSSFPEKGDKTTEGAFASYKYTVKLGKGSTGFADYIKTVELTNEDDDTTTKLSINGGTAETISSDTTKELFTLNAGTFRNLLAAGEHSIEFTIVDTLAAEPTNINGGGGIPNLDPPKKKVEEYKVTAVSTGISPAATFSPNGIDTGVYLLPGESLPELKVTNNYKADDALADGKDTVVTFFDFTKDVEKESGAQISDVTTTLNPTCKITMAKGDKAADTAITAEYDSITMTLDTSSDVVSPGDTKTHTIKVDRDAYQVADKVVLQNTSTGIKTTLENGTGYTWNGSSFSYTIPLGLASGNYQLQLTMDDGNVFYNTLTVNTDSPFSKTLEVNEGKSIYLYNFMTDAAKKKSFTVTSGDKTSVNTSGKSAAANTITVTGVTSGTGSIIVDGTSYPVTVHPKSYVSLSGGESSSSSGVISLSSDSKSSSSTKAVSVSVPKVVSYDDSLSDQNYSTDIKYARVYFDGDKKDNQYVLVSVEGSGDSKSGSISVKDMTKILKQVADGSSDEVGIQAYPNYGSGEGKTDYWNVPSDIRTMKVYKIKLDRSEGATYTVKQNGTELISSSDSTEYFYAIKGLTYNIKAQAKDSSNKDKSTFQKWDNEHNSNWDKADGGDFDADESKTFKAVYGSSTTPTPTPTPSPTTTKTTANGGAAGANGDGYDEVPKTGESKADIWILWSVLLISILGASFMIRKRFGLVRAIAAADEEMAQAVRDEKVEIEKKEKESKMQMLKDLRNL